MKREIDIRSMELCLRLAEDRLQKTKDDIKKVAKHITEDMQYVIERLDKSPGSINSLGELQSRAPELNRLCALLYERTEFVQNLKSCWKDEVQSHADTVEGG